jgi:hypothetical protein
MSTQNSTGDKLVASVRKSKSAATSSPKTTKKKVVRKNTQHSIKKKIAVRKTQTLKKQVVDMFQSGRRVWPD